MLVSLFAAMPGDQTSIAPASSAMTSDSSARKANKEMREGAEVCEALTVVREGARENPKSEARNPKQIQKEEKAKFKTPADSAIATRGPNRRLTRPAESARTQRVAF